MHSKVSLLLVALRAATEAWSSAVAVCKVGNGFKGFVLVFDGCGRIGRAVSGAGGGCAAETPFFVGFSKKSEMFPSFLFVRSTLPQFAVIKKKPV